MKSKRTLIMISGVLGVIIAVAAVMRIYPSASEAVIVDELIRPVKTVVLQAGSDIEVRPFPGIIQAGREVNLSFRVGGPLIQFNANTGQYFGKGEVIAEIDPRDYMLQKEKLNAAIKEAEANLSAMRTGAREEDIKLLEAELRAARAQFDEASLSFTRYKNLYDDGALSKAKYDSVKAALDMAEAQVDGVEQSLTKAGAGARMEEIQAMEARIVSLRTDLTSANNAIADTMLKAPFSGFINIKTVENYETVAPGQVIVSLLDFDQMQVHFSIPEEMVVMKDKFAGFTCEFEAFPDMQFNASLHEIGKKTTASNQSYPVTVIIENTGDSHRFAPGMAATVNIELEKYAEKKQGFILPVSALFADEHGNDHIWIVDVQEMSVHKKGIQVIEVTGSTVMLDTDIPSGSRIVTAGTKFLSEGQKVRLMESSQEDM